MDSSSFFPTPRSIADGADLEGSYLGANAVLPIAVLLESLGFAGGEAQRMARAALVDAGLSAPRKTNIAVHKQEQVENLLASRFICVCESNECVAKARKDGRELVPVPNSECEICAGGNADHAMKTMFQHLRKTAIKRMLVVGGSPKVHTELNRHFEGAGIDLDIVDGERALDARRAEALATRADVIVVWGSSILGHRVSTLFTQPKYGHKRVPLARRGLRSFADAVTQHVQLRPDR